MTAKSDHFSAPNIAVMTLILFIWSHDCHHWDLLALLVDSDHHFYLYHDDSVELNGDNMQVFDASQRFTWQRTHSTDALSLLGVDVVTWQQVFMVFNNSHMQFATHILMLDLGLVLLSGWYTKGKH
ncbi:hypothetical protein EDD18DRAFT_1360934 [Armillaria luteobubalina]|uniref:Uncharacterized protein n=1 Tax=Armillaria luteobubalina TaxID=153913 RepID=A0AA39PJK8_9AGAR|nr:hypothetical protein EDD18DRAFT_1360934 [Armillaria luteobubalina]